MNKIVIIMLSILLLGCRSEVNKEIDDSQLDKDFIASKPRVLKAKPILDTLVFNEDESKEALAKKYTEGQLELAFFKPFISENFISEVQLVTDGESVSEISYLGKLLDLDNQNSYHVLIHFQVIGIGKMESPRGISRVVFIHDNMDKAIIYRMDMPEELPKRIDSKVLYFEHESEEIGISISGGLPLLLCVPKIGCY